MYQISSLGSQDKQNSEFIGQLRNNPIDTENTLQLDFDASPNNPIVQSFQKMFTNPNVVKEFDTPENQMLLFDTDNAVKGQAGIYRTPQQGLSSFGSDIDGKPLYAFNDIANDKNFDLGKNRLYTAGTLMQQLGAFQNDEEADTFAKFTSNAGDPSFIGAINGLAAIGDKKTAVNTILKEFGYRDLDSLDQSEDKKRAYGTAFAAYNYVENAEKMSPAQQSLTLSTMGLISYKFKDGTTLADRALIKNPDGETAFNLSEAMNLAGSGIDVMSMQKNWDQLDVYQRLSYGKGTPSQLAATGKRGMLLGDPSLGGSAVYQSEADLGAIGFKSVPSAGFGAITGDSGALPDNYEVVGAGEKPGQVIAVPKGLSYSTSTINGSPEIRSLNAADGVKRASMGAFKTASNWLPSNTKNNLRGTSFAAGLGQSGVLEDPYMKSSIATASVHGNTVTRSDKGQIASTAQQTAEAGIKGGSQAAAVVAGAAVGAAQITGAAKVAQGQDPSLLEKGALFPIDGGASFVAGAFGAGGKSKEQQGRDSVRKLGTQSGLFNKDDWTVTLSDGSAADIGTDGHGGKHEFRFGDKAIGEKRSLNSYDVDYTNDLDFTSNMMTNALVRMMSGGKGVSIDQVAGQLGNAALGKAGFGADMTEENFNYVRDNVRGFFFKQGIQTKEDAYALSNQMLAEGRIAEMDAVAMQQGINMVFDEEGYDQAQILMAGRWKGLEVAADIPQAPGPNYDAKPKVREPAKLDIPEMTETQELEQYGLEMNPGSYNGPVDSQIFTKAIIKYQDPWSKRNGIKGG